MAEVHLNGGFDLAREALALACAQALEAMGQAWVGQARSQEAVFAKWGLALRDSIAHRVEGSSLTVGSGLDIAAYAELGTGPFYAPPPEWMENRVPRGGKVPPGAEHWIYRDPEDGAFRVGAYQSPTPFLAPALAENVELYRGLVEAALRHYQE